jgi:late competence protein required for DNA uptake (superfamily II DNA/RNA helicase)
MEKKIRCAHCGKELVAGSTVYMIKTSRGIKFYCADCVQPGVISEDDIAQFGEESTKDYVNDPLQNIGKKTTKELEKEIEERQEKEDEEFFRRHPSCGGSYC